MRSHVADRSIDVRSLRVIRLVLGPRVAASLDSIVSGAHDEAEPCVSRERKCVCTYQMIPNLKHHVHCSANFATLAGKVLTFPSSWSTGPLRRTCWLLVELEL